MAGHPIYTDILDQPLRIITDPDTFGWTTEEDCYHFRLLSTSAEDGHAVDGVAHHVRVIAPRASRTLIADAKDIRIVPVMGLSAVQYKLVCDDKQKYTIENLEVTKQTAPSLRSISRDLAVCVQDSVDADADPDPDPDETAETAETAEERQARLDYVKTLARTAPSFNTNVPGRTFTQDRLKEAQANAEKKVSDRMVAELKDRSELIQKYAKELDECRQVEEIIHKAFLFAGVPLDRVYIPAAGVGLKLTITNEKGVPLELDLPPRDDSSLEDESI